MKTFLNPIVGGRVWWARGSERGAMAVWVVVLLMAVLGGFAGLVYDGGRAATRQSELIDIAWSLARTGANQTKIDGNAAIIDDAAAWHAVTNAAGQWPDVGWDMTLGIETVTVRVTGSYETAMLRSIGVDQWDLKASRTADVKE